MTSDFFYSKSTKLYVSLKPLKINSRTKRAAESNNTDMSWDDEGRINYIDFDNSIKLLDALGAKMMSPIEYWLILKDAIEEENQDMINSLQSNEFCEWLNRVYFRNGTQIDNAKVLSRYKYKGEQIKSEYLHSRPGWFTPKDNIDYKTGLPIHVDQFRNKFENSWKYWSPDFSVTKLDTLAPIRGYVTSVGKPSFDLGIPVDSKQPVQMVRECRNHPRELIIEEKILKKADKLINAYKAVVKDLKDETLYTNLKGKEKELRKFLLKYGDLFKDSKELMVYDRREQFFNMVGLLKLITSRIFDEESEKLTNIDSKELDIKDFKEFITTSYTRLEKALKENKNIVFVMGHENPDADTVISSLFEAWRNQFLDRDIEYIPLVQSEEIPNEIKELLGNPISKNIMLRTSPLYKKVKNSGLSRWISVDQNRDKNVQKYFISIVDHHVISPVALKQDIPKTLEMCGSCACLVTNKFLGMGLTFDKKLAEILYGATLLDTENRVKHKMTIKDKYTMDYLKNISNIKDDDDFYGHLMFYLLNTNNPEILFRRDYKEDWGFGFAVAKVRECFDKEGKLLKKQLVDKAKKLAKSNNIEKNLPLTILRITDYQKDCITVNRERVFLVFNSSASKEFVNSSYMLLKNIVEFEFEGTKILQKNNEYLEFWGTGMQLSRKKTAPQFEPLVKSYNKYFYSPTLNKYIKRNFLKKTHNVEEAALKKNLEISVDLENNINYITYPEAKTLLKELNFTMLSLNEYWSVLNDAKKIKDGQMINSLQGSNFVELLDTIVFNSEKKIDHPFIRNTTFNGNKENVEIPKGSPGLIHPDDINLKSGFPNIVRSPNEYGNPELWRYWEPDANIVNPVRSYIFLLKQPCLDCKMHPEDSFPNLGVRPVTDIVKQPKINIWKEKKHLCMNIESEGDIVKYVWSK